MKKHIKLLSLILCMIIVFASFAACGNNSGNSTPTNENAKDTQKTPDSSDKTQSSIIDESKALIIYQNGAYTAKFIMPDLASDAEQAVYAKLRGVIKDKIKADVAYNTDLIPPGGTRDPNETAVLLGNTNYEESKKATENTSYGDYSIKIIGNKAVISFTSKEDGIDLVNLLAKSIKTDGNGCYWIDRSLSISKQALPQLGGLPKYPSNETSLVDCHDNTSMIVARRTTLSDFKGYCTALEQTGFVLDASRDDVNGNYFRTYIKGGLAVTAYFTPSNKTARIIAGPSGDIPTKEIDNTPETVKPSITLLSQGERYDNGLGMIYLLPNGKFLIIDGGYVRSNQLYNILQSLAPNKDQITITAWFMSHPHGDHQRMLTSFLKENYKNVKLESILYNYTTSDQYTAITTGPDGAESAKSLESTISRYASKDTKIIKPHTGQIYKYGSTTVEIMYTVEDVLPQTLDYLNTSSLVVRVNIGDHSMLALADTTHISGDIMHNMYGSYLQSDMVQLAHHGTFPGYASLYNAIKAPVLIWPSNLQNATKQQNDGAVIAAINNATDIYVVNSGTVTIDLPYTQINNKQQFLQSIGGN